VDKDMLDRVQKFLDNRETGSRAAESTDSCPLMWADVQMLVAVVKAGTADEDDDSFMKEFLASAQRGVEGWRRANTNQIGTIGRLQEELRLLGIELRGVRKSWEIAEERILELEEWQNEVAQLIPEDSDGINPEGKQEGIIIDYIKYLQDKVSDYEGQANLERGFGD
jgi:hypothetical protein